MLLAEHIPSVHLSAAVHLLVDALLPNELEKRAAKGEQDAALFLRRKEDGSGWLIRGELGLRDKVAPHLGATISLPALNRDPGATPAVGASGVTLPLSLVQKWWCDAAVTRFVLGLGHRVLEVSHTARTLKAHERRIKHLETGGHCQGAGCCRGPGATLIPHHVDPRHRRHSTSLEDTVLLCEADHAALHRGQTITLKDGRRLNANGWVD